MKTNDARTSYTTNKHRYDGELGVLSGEALRGVKSVITQPNVSTARKWFKYGHSASRRGIIRPVCRCGDSLHVGHMDPTTLSLYRLASIHT
jgi:hypothetical protein